MISFIKDADTNKLHCIIRISPTFTIYPNVLDLVRQGNVHEYAVQLGAEIIYQLCDTLADQIEEDLKVWKKEYVNKKEDKNE